MRSPTPAEPRWSRMFPRPTPTTAPSCKAWSNPYPPFDPDAARAAANRLSSAPTRATTPIPIARRGVDDPARLGRHRWKIERTIAWLTGYRRLTIRYKRDGNHFLGFLQLAAAITCYKILPT
jgi:transposase